jgi:DNA-directed RNA polymerase subunit RPC12/RpoP
MKCPWCSRDIGLPSPSRSSAQCPYCGGKYTYAFRAKTVLKYLLLGLAVAWLLLPYLGAAAVLMAVLLPFAAGLYLEKWV